MREFLNFDFIITKIVLAIRVESGCGSSGKNNRPFHGIVFNVSDATKEYIFESGERIEVGKNEMIFLPQGSTYRVVTEHSGDCYAINFEYLGEKIFPPFLFVPKNVLAMERQFERAVNLFRNKEDGYRMLCRSTLYEILAEMQSESRREYLTRSTIFKIAPAIEYIHQHYTEPIQISTLASLCEISEDYLRKIFHSSYQTTPVKYIADLRMRYAKALISTGEYGIAEVALLSGFSDPAYFSREFHRVYGVSPVQFKNQK